MSKKGRELPDVKGWLTTTTLAAASKVTGKILRALRPTTMHGRQKRFEELVDQRLGRSPYSDLKFRVGVQHSFGKPLLVTFDLLSQRENIPTAFAKDLMERVTEALWHNPEVAPVSIRGRLLLDETADKSAAGDEKGPARHTSESTLREAGGPQVLLDMRDLGFQDEIVRASDLYLTFGPPAADPNFHP